MRRTEPLQEIRKMRFEEAYEGWQHGRLTQREAASLLGISERTLRGAALHGLIRAPRLTRTARA